MNKLIPIAIGVALLGIGAFLVFHKPPIFAGPTLTVDADFDFVKGYTTYRFDTVDGDLNFGQYADDGRQYIVRTLPKSRANFITAPYATDVSGLTRVDIIGETNYQEYVNSQGMAYRIQTPSKEHPNLTAVSLSQAVKDEIITGKDAKPVVYKTFATTTP